MPRIQIGQKRVAKTWQQLIQEQIHSGKALPVLSNALANRLVLGDHDHMIEAYADYLNYPMPERHDLSRMTQYVSVMEKQTKGTLEIKNDYLSFIKSSLLQRAETEHVSPDLLEDAEARFDAMDFSALADSLGYPHFGDSAEDPLLILADLPVPIYLSTSYHRFLETALKRAGKQPRSDVCRWHRGMRERPSVFAGDYQPAPQAPLVYHLYGLDDEPTSLVLTEDNHMEFLGTVSKNPELIPARMYHALSDSALILLGYHLQSWDFRTLFWSLLKPRELKQQGVSVLQLPPSAEEQKYYQEYLEGSEFKVFWGTIEEYTRQLYEDAG